MRDVAYEEVCRGRDNKGSFVPPVENHFGADTRAIVAKELIQMSNRSRFHAEKALFVVGLSGAFIVALFGVTGKRSVDLRLSAEFGRAAFIAVSSCAWIVLSLVSLWAATGIILSEALGKRLDLLRVTAIPLGLIVLGKGLALTLRSSLFLALVMPIMAAMYLRGGVALDDIAMVVAVIFANMLFCTAVGLVVSAGSRSTADRVMRTLETMLGWAVVLTLLSILLVPLGPQAYALTPPGFFELLSSSRLSWEGVLLNVIIWLAGAMWFASRATRVLERTAAAYGNTVEDPKARLVMRFPALVKWAGRHLAFLKFARPDTLIGMEVFQTNLAVIVAPLAILTAQLLTLLLTLIMPEAGAFRAADLVGLCYLACAVSGAVMVLVAASSTLARDKVLRTGDLLVLTPEGGASMIWWKACAVFTAQGVTIGAGLVFAPIAALQTPWPLLAATTAFLGLTALLLLAFAIGISFSQLSRTPSSAVGLTALALLVLMPAVQYLIRRFMWERVAAGGGARVLLLPQCALGAALLAVVLRNFWKRAAPALLVAGVAVAMASWPFLVYDQSAPGLPLAGLSAVMLPALVFPATDYDVGAFAKAVACAALEIALAAALLGGMFINFERRLLEGGGKSQ